LSATSLSSLPSAHYLLGSPRLRERRLPRPGRGDLRAWRLPRLGRGVKFDAVFQSSPNSLRLNVFADPHPLNPAVSIFYENVGGRGPSLIGPSTVVTLSTFNLLVSLSPLAATLIALPASVANKGLMAQLKPLDATLTKNQG